jgi:hypothetical protein
MRRDEKAERERERDERERFREVRVVRGVA